MRAHSLAAVTIAFAVVACTNATAPLATLPVGPGFSGSAQGDGTATYYVATTGSDSNPGTSSAPFRTLQAGVNAARPGDTVLVRDGVYGPNGVGPDGFPVSIRKAGTAVAWITLRAEHRLGAVLDCDGGCHSYVALFDGAAYWVIQGFDVTRTRWGAVWANNGTAHDIRIAGNHFHHIGNRFESSPYGIVGFYSNALNHDLVFDGNVFNDIGRTGGLPYPNHDHGIYSHATNVIVANNVFYNLFGGWAIALDGGANWLIANNTFAFPNPARTGQVLLHSVADSAAATVTNVVIRNNIFYRPSEFAVITYPSVPPRGCTIDHNLVYGATGLVDRPDWCTASANVVGKDPLFVNPLTPPYDFHLRSGRAAVGVGVNLSAIFDHDPDGRARQLPPSPWDLGAYRWPSVLRTGIPLSPLGSAPSRRDSGGSLLARPRAT